MALTNILRGLQMVASHGIKIIQKENAEMAKKLAKNGLDVCHSLQSMNKGTNTNSSSNTNNNNNSNNVDNDDDIVKNEINLNQNPTYDEMEQKLETKISLKPKMEHILNQQQENDESSSTTTSSTSLSSSSAIPSTQFSRAINFASLGFGLTMGTMAEVGRRVIGVNNNKYSPVASQQNADRLTQTLCRMRGAALKLGQMLSIQDEDMLPPTISRALQQVRQGADAMPKNQLYKQLTEQLGEDWRKLFIDFDENPIAAASIGQVHKATIFNSKGDIQTVAVKIQYPGVADSIESDLSNLAMMLRLSGFTPPGLFLEEIIRVGREELMVECDYEKEKLNQKKFLKLIQNDTDLQDAKFVVPNVIDELSTKEILTTQYAYGGSIDKVLSLSQEERNRIGRSILLLTLRELFEWRFMQTDPNWGNFLYDMGTATTTLLDFGAAREYDKQFVDGYLQIVWSASNKDSSTLLDYSHTLGFLTGEENEIMRNAHLMSGFVVGEPFALNEPFDFKASNITARLSEHGAHFLKHRLTPPPEEVYTLHRKLVGAINLCIKLEAVFPCRDLLESVYHNYVFESGGNNIINIESKEVSMDEESAYVFKN